MTSIEWNRVLLYVRILYENRISRLLFAVSSASSCFVFVGDFGHSFCALFILWNGASPRTHATHTCASHIDELVSGLVPVVA